MSDSASRLPARPSLEQLQKQAKELLRKYRAGERAQATLADAQFAVAREYGFDTWAKLKHYIENLRPPGIEQYEQLAHDVAAAYMTSDTHAIRTVNWNYGTDIACDFHNPVQIQQRLTTWFASQDKSRDLALADARRIVAHSYGFESWAEFAAIVSQPPRDTRSAPLFMLSTPPFYKI